MPSSKSDDSEGNIGTLAGHALKRLPSNVYWQGLGVWAFGLSEARISLSTPTGRISEQQ